jgi:hypothetical protein
LIWPDFGGSASSAAQFRGGSAAVSQVHLPGKATAYSDHVPDQDGDAADQLEPRVAAAVVDVFVYVVVLNLFVEYLPRVISETFTLSLLTAVLLKGVLEIVVAAKNRVKTGFRQASTPRGKVVAAVLLWVVLFRQQIPRSGGCRSDLW